MRERLLVADSGPLIALAGISHLHLLGLSITGTAGILVRAKKEGMVETVGPLLHKMREQGYFLSDAVIQYACRQAKEADPIS